MQEKTCTECGITKPIIEFYKDDKCLYGVRSKCKECEKKRHANRYKNNRDEIIQKNKEWKDRIKEDKTIPFWNMRATKVNERCQKKGVYGLIVGEDLLDAYNKQDRRCYFCHRKLDDDFHIDHIVPISRGGTNVANNIAITCDYCNLHKSNNIFDEKEFFYYVKEMYFRLREKYEMTGNSEDKT